MNPCRCLVDPRVHSPKLMNYSLADSSRAEPPLNKMSLLSLIDLLLVICALLFLNLAITNFVESPDKNYRIQGAFISLIVLIWTHLASFVYVHILRY